VYIHIYIRGQPSAHRWLAPEAYSTKAPSRLWSSLLESGAVPESVPIRQPVSAVRYVEALREGGSLPAILELADGRLIVAKFRGAGQGPKALIAELVAGELARAFGLAVPEIVVVELDPDLARTERDEEVGDLLRASAGLNLGLAYLPGALMYDPGAGDLVDAALASRVVILDAFVMNVDRTARNPNLLWWKNGLWLIDHGAAMYWQHDWNGSTAGADRPFNLIAQHVLLPVASELAEAGRELRSRITKQTIADVVAAVPDAWLVDGRAPNARRQAYTSHFCARLDAADVFVQEAIDARARL
jgi:hypothetical protein